MMSAPPQPINYFLRLAVFLALLLGAAFFAAAFLGATFLEAAFFLGVSSAVASAAARN